MIHGIGLLEDTEEAREVLLEAHRQFLRAGGILSPEWFAMLPPWMREVCANAGDDIAREHAVYHAMAISSPGGVLAPLDDGELLVKTALQDGVSEALNGGS